MRRCPDFPCSALAVAAAAIVFVACGPDAPAPSAPAVPERAILFGPNLTATAVRLGHAERVVAITDYCRWPSAMGERPRVGGAVDPDLEAIAALDPDLLVLQGQAETLRAFAAAQDIAVADVKMDDDVPSILRGIVAVDSLLGGGGDGGRALADSLRDGLDAIEAERAGDVPEVFLVISRDPGAARNVLTAGAGTFLDDLLRTIGLAHWGGRRGLGYFDASLEILVSEPPDVVVEIVTDPDRADTARATAVWRRLLGDDVEVRQLVHRDALVPGPGIVDTARALARLLDPVGTTDGDG